MRLIAKFARVQSEFTLENLESGPEKMGKLHVTLLGFARLFYYSESYYES